MAWVTLSLGSNTDPYTHLAGCLDSLLLHFQDMSLSSVFESEAVGFAGDNFLNMVVGLHTDLDVAGLAALLKDIENKHGRDRSQPRFSGRSLDIDILTFGKLTGVHGGVTLPRAEITENAFVLWPLSQVAAKDRHPLLNETFGKLWDNYDKDRQKIWPVDFQWHGRMISRQD